MVMGKSIVKNNVKTILENGRKHTPSEDIYT